jgi:DnaJ family protein C protein 11
MSSSSNDGHGGAHGDSGGASSSTTNNPPDRSLYAILNVRPDATDDEIRRAYRQLATTYHPDKAQDETLLADANLAFHRIQEAYEVLSDPLKRDIYDVYGLEGVRSGLELSIPGKTPEQMRKEFESAREKRQKEDVDAAVNFRGQYEFRVDATALVSPYDTSLPRTPELKTVSMNSGIDIPIESSKDWGPLSSESDTLHLGGFVYVRGDHGGGSFLAGYKRVYADYTTFELHGMAGLKTLISAQTSVQLSPLAGATMAASWQPGKGMGLQIITSRQLGDATNGEISWVVGPREEAGMALALTHRPNDLTQVSGKIEVGAATGITLRGARRLGEDITARAGVKVGITGVECDIGASRRLSELSTAGLTVVTGYKKGVLLRIRYSRGGHLFEFPIQLSAGVDPGVLLAAHILPPLALYIASEWILKPLGKAIEGKRAATERQKRAVEIQEATRQANAAAQLMEPVAIRKMNKEKLKGGLVIALALYGEEEAVLTTASSKLAEKAAAAAAVKEELQKKGEEDTEKEQIGDVSEIVQEESTSTLPTATTTTATAAEISPQTPLLSPPSLPDTPQKITNKDKSNTDRESIEIPAAVIDVTRGLQYLVDTATSTVILHQGYSKSGLMGFCDPAPLSTKVLLVYYSYQGQVYLAKVADTEGAKLPGRGVVVESGEAELVKILTA